MNKCFIMGNTSTRSVYIDFASSVIINELVLVFLGTKRRND